MRPLLPREHGVWAWLGVPLLAALVVAPHPTTLLAGLAVLCGFGASNAIGLYLRRGEADALRAGRLAAAAAAPLAVAAVVLAPLPLALMLGMGAVGVVGAAATWRYRGLFPRSAALEIAGIAVFTALAGSIAVAAGGSPDRVLAAGALVFAWLVLGAWWIQRTLTLVMPKREPQPARIAAAGIAIGLSLGIGFATGHPLIGALVLLYPARVLLHPRPRSPKDAKALGLTELGWAAAVAVVAGAAV